jgi:hypothetical protein
MLYTMYQKAIAEADFKIPMQGYYAGEVSEAVKSAWHGNR